MPTGRPGRLDRSARRSARAIRRDRDPRGQRRQPAPGLGSRACDRPVVVVGLGAQAASSGDDVSLTPGTVAYLRALSERTEVLGVRGEFSAATLARIGVSNTLVMGCPSNFIARTQRSVAPPSRAPGGGSHAGIASPQVGGASLYRWMAQRACPQSGPRRWGWSDTARR
ncbi:MAG: polysaccharide pyruvyl transferase family protein [Actinobacteria bacterium]|nr:polysaccharide pyruvyl transferase family protein [Actinomycetota bacterium]